MNKKYYSELVELLVNIDTHSRAEDLLQGFLTPAELEQVTLRLQIVKLLKKGETHRDIAEKLGVGVATVARGASELKQGRFEYIEVESRA